MSGCEHCLGMGSFFWFTFCLMGIVLFFGHVTESFEKRIKRIEREATPPR